MLKHKSKIVKRRGSRSKKWLFIPILLCIIAVIGVTVYIYRVHFYKKPVQVAVTVPKISSIDQQVIEFKSLLAQKGVTYTKLQVSSSEFIIYLTDGSEVIFSPQKDLLEQISSLQYIRSQLTMEGRQFSKLDERYDNPVIVFR